MVLDVQEAVLEEVVQVPGQLVHVVDQDDHVQEVDQLDPVQEVDHVVHVHDPEVVQLVHAVVQDVPVPKVDQPDHVVDQEKAAVDLAHPQSSTKSDLQF